MNFEEYKNKRLALIAQAESLLAADDVTAAGAARQEIEALDTAFNAAAQEKANLAALQNRPVLDLEGKSAAVSGVVSAAVTGHTTPDDKEIYTSAFGKYLLNMSMEQREADVFHEINTKYRNEVQTADKHQVLVPETVRDNIWTELRDSHPILKDISLTFVPGDLTLIKETKELGAAQWVDEADEAESGDMAFGELNLGACELTRAVTVSWKMKKMSIPAFLAYVTSEIARRMGDGLAFGVMQGKGKPGDSDPWKAQPKGILPTLEAETDTPQIVEYSSAITYKDLTMFLSKVKSGYLKGASIYARNTDIWVQMANVVDGMKRPMFIPDVTAGGIGRLFGVVVKEEDAVPEGQVLIANAPKGYAMNVNENITMHYQDFVKKRITDYMGYAIVDGDVLTTKAFALLKPKAVTP